jgi:hypothetical protein
MMRPTLICIGIAMIAAPALAAAQGPDYDQGYRRGYDDGFASGYRKGLNEAGRVPAAPPPPPVPVIVLGPIRVNSAFYGTASRTCDARHHVAQRANGRRSATIDVTNDMCGDPAQGERKQLEVNYQCGSVAKSASAYEHRRIFLDCTN